MWASVEVAGTVVVTYHVADVAALDQWWDGVCFDGAICEMAFMDIDDLDGALNAVARSVSPERLVRDVDGPPLLSRQRRGAVELAA